MEEEKKYELKEIRYSDLKLNLSSPRLPKSIQEKNEAVVMKFMLLEAATLNLMMAIGQNDFFGGEPLLVVEDNTERDKYIVVEGNRRLTAVKLLSKPELANAKKESIKQIIQEAIYKPKKIPCLVFKDEKYILKHLGFKHIIGGNSWRIFEKARYLYKLKQKEFPYTPFREACRKLAKIIGTRRNYVQRLVIGYGMFLKIEEANFYGISNLDDSTFNFNCIVCSLTYDKIVEFLGVNSQQENPLEHLKHSHLKKWTHWIFEKNANHTTRLIGDSHNLNMLNKVLENPEAYKGFDRGEQSLNQAYERYLDNLHYKVSIAEQ